MNELVERCSVGGVKGWNSDSMDWAESLTGDK